MSYFTRCQHKSLSVSVSVSKKNIHYVLLTSELQFGLKKGLFTTQCTFSMLEIIDYYNLNKYDVGVLLLDVSKILIEVIIASYSINY